MIQIFLENILRSCLAYDVSPDSPISTLKAAIEQEEGIPVAQQYLVFQGQELEDTRTFSSFNISDGSIVQFGRKPTVILVKLLTGWSIFCRVDLDAPVLFLERALQDMEKFRVGKDRLVFITNVLDSDQTLGFYKVSEFSTIKIMTISQEGKLEEGILVIPTPQAGRPETPQAERPETPQAERPETLEAGIPETPQAMYATLDCAVACCPWDGDMNHHSIKGLRLSHRGMVVVIIGQLYMNWYRAREPDLGPESEGAVPFNFVHIVGDLRYNPSRGSGTTSETKEIKALGLNNFPQDLPIVPEGSLPPFLYPWAEPRIFSRAFADSGHSFLEICITYNQVAIPGEPTVLNVTLKCHAFDDRVSEVSIQVTVPNSEVLDVQSPPPIMPAWREGEMQVKLSTRNEQKSGVNVGLGGPPTLSVSHGDTSVTGEERSGTVPNTQVSITGHSLHGDTASWWIKEGATVMGGAGLPAELSNMSFTINKQPESFRFDCLVKVGRGKKYSLKSSGGSSLWYKLLYGFGL